MKRFLLILISLSCVYGCSLDKARSGDVCPPADADNAKAYIYKSSKPILLTDFRCPDDEPMCAEFTPDHRLRGNYYCHVPCTGTSKACYGECTNSECTAQDGNRCPEACLYSCNTDGKCPCVNCDKGCDNNGNCCLIAPDVDGTCKQIEGCINGHNPDGSCACVNCTTACDNNGICCLFDAAEGGTCNPKDGCVNGNNEDGSCTPKDGCVNGNNDDGSCIQEEGCIGEWNTDGTCKQVDGCKAGWNENGSCKQKEGCADGWNEDGSCKQKEGCVDGWNEDGSCKQKEGCVNDWNDDGSCIQDAFCVVGWNEDGSCKQMDGCDGWNSNGSCKCSKCTVGCTPDGDCIIDLVDKNGNHMIDAYETAIKQGEDCRKNTDCDLSQDIHDGFCDSFIDYKCSTKCTDDTQCIGNDGEFNYICRSDGRCAPNEFITVWELPFNNDKNMLYLFFDQDSECRIQIDWGDGRVDWMNCSDRIFHSYTIQSETITVKISKDSGNPKGFHVDTDNECKLKEIVSFSDIGLGANAFKNCYLLDTLSAVDIPDSDKLTTMENMFRNNCSFNYPINRWDVSSVENMNKAFWMPNCAEADNDDARICDIPSRFNQPLDKWDVSKVKIMTDLFGYLPIFNQPLNEWDVSNVANMEGMFGAATSFNQPLDKWQISNASESVESMFYKARSFNQDISSWDVSNTRNMKYMFEYADSFNQDLSSWHVNPNTALNFIFHDSGMSPDNLCLISTSETWPLEFRNSLADNCPNQSDP